MSRKRIFPQKNIIPKKGMLIEILFFLIKINKFYKKIIYLYLLKIVETLLKWHEEFELVAEEITFKEQSSDFPEISNFWEPNIEYCGVRFVVWFESTKIMRFIKKDKISKAWGMVLSFLIS